MMKKGSFWLWRPQKLFSSGYKLQWEKKQTKAHVFGASNDSAHAAHIPNIISSATG